MKKSLLVAVLGIPVLLLFSGCPVGMDYPLGAPGKEPIDKALLGTWENGDANADFGVATITKRDDYSYHIEVSALSEMYGLDVTEFTGWVTTLEGKTFLYAQPVGSTDTDYYLYNYQTGENGTIKSYDVSLLINGVDGVTSTETYREEVKASMAMEDFLSSEYTWTKKQ